jgi:ribosomal protein S19
MYCRHKRRSIWKGFLISKSLLFSISNLVNNKKVDDSDSLLERVSRNFVLYPFLHGNVYEVYNGKFFDQYTLRNRSSFYSKIGQYIYFLKMGSSIHSKKSKKVKNISKKKK